MTKQKRQSFCIVCIANFCRSPVLEALLIKRFGEEFEFFSAGISPMAMPSMDKRSKNFLEKKGIKNTIHTPKKISKKMLDYFDYFLAVDHFVLNQLNILYPRYKKKFRLCTSSLKNVDIIDPFKLADIAYIEVMNRIDFTANNIDLNYT